MYHKRARLGTWVTVTHDIDQAAEGTCGVINEIRGYDREQGGEIVARFVMVWCENQVLPDGTFSGRKNLTVSTKCIEENRRLQ
jgi:hypothetical protein